MKLYLSRCAASAGRDAPTVVFLLHDALGQPCGRVERLSGLLSDGFHLCGTLPDRGFSVYVSCRTPPYGTRCTVRVQDRCRAQLSALPNGTIVRAEVDGLPCSLLGVPAAGEFTLTDSVGRVLFAQQRQPAAGGQEVYVLTIPDEDRAEVHLGISVFLSRHRAEKTRPLVPDTAVR